MDRVRTLWHTAASGRGAVRAWLDGTEDGPRGPVPVTRFFAPGRSVGEVRHAASGCVVRRAREAFGPAAGPLPALRLTAHGRDQASPWRRRQTTTSSSNSGISSLSVISMPM